MKPSCLKLAAEIVAAAGQSQRADAVLREALKQQRGVTVSEAREIADFVLGWFRWRGWLDFSETQEKQFADVAELDERFRGDPESFSEDELSRAVPDWIWDEMEVSKAWLRSLQAKPRLWLRAKRGRGRALAEKLGDCWIPDGYPEAVEYRCQFAGKITHRFAG